MRRAQRLGLLTVLVAVLLGAATAAPAGACSIAAVPVEQQVAAAAIAFTGTVQQVTPASATENAVTVTVDRVVKGTIAPSVTLTAARSWVDVGGGISMSNTCAMTFAPGQRAAFLLATGTPPWPVDLGNVIDDTQLDAIPAPGDFHATAITALLARPAQRSLRLRYSAPACATLAAFVHERAGAVRVGLRTATPPACRTPPVTRCATVVLRSALGARTLHPARARHRVAFASAAACPRAGAFAS
jgi:hypothetical protein